MGWFCSECIFSIARLHLIGYLAILGGWFAANTSQPMSACKKLEDAYDHVWQGPSARGYAGHGILDMVKLNLASEIANRCSLET